MMKCPVFKDFGHDVVPVIAEKYPFVQIKTVMVDKENEILTPMNSADLRKIADYLDYILRNKLKEVQN